MTPDRAVSDRTRAFGSHELRPAIAPLVGISLATAGGSTPTFAGNMKISYFGSTWAASCAASTGGAIYAAVAAAIVSRGRIGMMEIAWIVLISILVSLPVLVAGSATIGWWVSKYLARRVRTNRLLVFAMAGMSMGLIADLILLVFGILFLGFSLSEIPRGMDELINACWAASIPVLCLTLAGLVAGAHITCCEGAGDGTPPPT